SSDGLAGDGLIEIKCPKYSTHFDSLVKGGYDSKYQWQLRGQMWIYDKPHERPAPVRYLSSCIHS
ncbi:MAG TPA: hypothetical protein ENH82_13500, partial [bacterium]|nr:hypothetical protein [bacterium]